jgi:hypothetical protein
VTKAAGTEAPLSKRWEGLLPDIVEAIPFHLTVQNTRQESWLRFTTGHINIGDGKLQIHGGGNVAPCDIDGVHYDQCTHAYQEVLDADGNVAASYLSGTFIFHPEHNHWHQEAVAAFEIRSGSENGPVVTRGEKVTFCLIDYRRVWDTVTNGDRTYWECNGDYQGITPGFNDQYHHSTEGQELEISHLPTGDYWLTHEADPENRWVESNEDNNFAWVKFHLSWQGANPEIEVLEWSDCVEDVSCPGGTNR